MLEILFDYSPRTQLLDYIIIFYSNYLRVHAIMALFFPNPVQYQLSLVFVYVGIL